MTVKTSLICGEAVTLDDVVDHESIDLIVTQAPAFGEMEGNYDKYSKYMCKVFLSCFNVLKDGSVFALVVPPHMDRFGKRENVASWLAMELEIAGFTFMDHIKVKNNEYTQPRSTTFKKTKGQPRTYSANVITKDVYLYSKRSLRSIPGKQEWTKFIYKKPVSKSINTLDEYTEISEPKSASRTEYYQDWLLTDVWEVNDSLTRLLIQLFSYDGEVVFDPFATNSDVSKQAQMLGRNVVGLAEGRAGIKMLQKTLAYGMPSLLATDEERIFETIDEEG